MKATTRAKILKAVELVNEIKGELAGDGAALAGDAVSCLELISVMRGEQEHSLDEVRSKVEHELLGLRVLDPEGHRAALRWLELMRPYSSSLREKASAA